MVNNVDRGGRTPLHLGAFHGYTDVVASLIDKGAESHKKDKTGRTGLHWAAFRGHLPVLEVLLGCVLAHLIVV